VPVALVSALRHRVSGVPFLIEEMLSAYVAAGGPEERRREWWISRRIADALPPSYRDVVRTRLTALDEGARRVVEAAAVLGRGFEWRLLATITETDESEVLERLRAAARAGLIASSSGHVPGFEFRHALAREAVLAELLPPERAALSARTADAIEATQPGLPGEWCQRAADLWEEGGENLRAMGALQEAARRAIARSAFASAEQMLTRARVLAGDDLMGWMGVDDLLLDALASAGKPGRVRELGTSLIDVYGTRYPLHAERFARIHLKVARGLAPAGDWDGVADHLQRARDAAGPAGDAALLAGIDALAARAALALGARSRADELAGSARRAAHRSGSREAMCEALDAEGRAAIAAGHLERGTAAFVRCAETAARSRFSLWEARALLELGAVDEVTTGELGRLHEARAVATRSGAVSVEAAADLCLSWGHLGHADLQAARPALERCLMACRVQRLEILPEALTALCMLHALRDEASEFEAAAEEALSAGKAAASEAGVLGNGRAVLALVHGDEAEALVHLEAAVGLATGAGEWSLLWLRGLRALLRTAAGPVEAIREAEPVVRRDPRVAAYLGFAQAIAHGRAGRADQAVNAFTAAENAMGGAGAASTPGSSWRAAPSPMDGASRSAGCSRGSPYSTPRRFPGSRAPARQCSGGPAPRCRGESAVPASLQGVGVTSREMDVLKLVAERLGNKEIGKHLYLSPRTIEGHVASLIRKLGLESRSELIAAARRFAADAATHARAETS